MLNLSQWYCKLESTMHGAGTVPWGGLVKYIHTQLSSEN